MNTDPFRHHSKWRDYIVNPQTSRFRNIDLAVLDRARAAEEIGTSWRSSEEQRELSRRSVLAHREQDGIWVFACGSLVWDPGFSFDEVRLARVDGLSRRFCLRSELGRGTPENPGLMIGFDHGNVVASVAFHIAPEHVVEETQLLWRREMLLDGYRPEFVPACTAQGDIEALAFIANTDSPRYIPKLDTLAAAQIIATAHGIYGSNLNYVKNLVENLEAFGIVDDSMAELYRLACDEFT